ncbi:DsrE family protein [Sulfuriferula thiophila]|uniref:DsrE family protein n=1 Tax=Sulfuriferula thiophila TaxID=1781211 RepID=UPI000F606D69|nr:DsrE family protein [Sulfuriferula thiophila]
MKIKFWLIALILSLTSLSAVAAEQVKHRLLIQVSEDSVERLMAALNAAKFVQDQYGAPNVEIEIVVFGPGVQTLKYYAPKPVPDRVKQAKYNGIRIVACDYSMRAAKLRPSDMLREISYVPSGVVEIMEKEQLGWSYIRP